MGGCVSSCCCCGSSGDGNTNDDYELELQAKVRKALKISKSMSAPTIHVSSKNEISGIGLALIGVSIEQDAAYWEWHIHLGVQNTLDSILFGVTTEKNTTFYKSLKDKILPEEGTPSEVTGTQYMRRIAVENGDVIGVAVQQSDLPMVQFTLNGEALHISAINRFRGTVYPSICLPETSKELQAEITLVTAEDEFRHPTFGNRFLPLIVARSVV